MRKAFQNDFDISVIEYDHWNTGNQMDFYTEVEKIKNLNMRFDVVLGKSAGAVLAMLATTKGCMYPERAILLGTPMKAFLSDGEGKGIFSKYDVPTIFIQQTNDPYSSFSELKELVGEKEKATVIEVPGNDHSYDSIGEIKVFLD
mgnify:FL=1